MLITPQVMRVMKKYGVFLSYHVITTKIHNPNKIIQKYMSSEQS